MVPQFNRSPILKEILLRHNLKPHNSGVFSVTAYKGTRFICGPIKKTEREYSYTSHQQQCSILRSLTGLTGVIGGTALIFYLNPSIRDYVTESTPQLKPYLDRISHTFTTWKKKFDAFPSFKFFNTINVPAGDVRIGPTFPSTSDVLRQVSETPQSTDGLKGDIYSAIKATEKAVNDALSDLRNLQNLTRRQLSKQQASWCNTGPPAFVGRWLAAAEHRAKESHQNAQKELIHLRALIDSAKLNASDQDKETLRAAISSYGNLAYDLAGVVAEIRHLQNQSSVFKRLAMADKEDKSKLHEEMNSILSKSLSRKPLLKDDGSEMTAEEVNALLVISLERIVKLQETLKASGDAAKRHIAMALQNYKNEADRITQEAVDLAIHQEEIKRELERLEWEKQAHADTERELNTALARHGHHLAYMLRLKQEELDNQFNDRLCEAVAEQKAAIGGEIRRWIRRMEAIEHVVDSRADIDHIAKEKQALWLAVQAFAFALEMPFSKIGVSGAPELEPGKLKPFYKGEPLGGYADAVKKTAGNHHEFANVVVESLPREALTDGVWTRQGLLQRFNKVYKTARDVALVDETGGSLWSYAMSWLQSRMLFDRLGRRRILARLPGVGPSLLTPDSEWPKDVEKDALPDAFCLLASARAALMPEADVAVNLNCINCADIEFAVRLLSQLRGQTAAVAADWIRDARHFLEVHQAIQALLAYTTSQNFTVFEGST